MKRAHQSQYGLVAMILVTWLVTQPISVQCDKTECQIGCENFKFLYGRVWSPENIDIVYTNCLRKCRSLGTGQEEMTTTPQPTTTTTPRPTTTTTTTPRPTTTTTTTPRPTTTTTTTPRPTTTTTTTPRPTTTTTTTPRPTTTTTTTPRPTTTTTTTPRPTTTTTTPRPTTTTTTPRPTTTTTTPRPTTTTTTPRPTTTTTTPQPTTTTTPRPTTTTTTPRPTTTTTTPRPTTTTTTPQPTTTTTTSQPTTTTTTTRPTTTTTSPRPTKTTTPRPTTTTSGLRKFCGLRIRNSVRIIGGVAADICEFPWVVTLLVNHNFCGGTLVDRRHVITAAHCVTDMLRGITVTVSPRNVIVGYGFSNRDFMDTVKVIRVLSHPLFNYTSLDYDVAVLTLAEDLVYDECVSPICLPDVNSDPNEADKYIAAGWGRTDYSRPGLPINLQKVDLSIVDQELCSQSYGNEGPTINELKLCAGDFQRGGIGPCKGDSGGPLMYETEGVFYLHGIVSFGNGRCATPGYPGVFTRVTHPAIMDFIKEGISDSSISRD